MYYVSRQMQWPDGMMYVEIAVGGLDYSSPGMLANDLGGEGEYTDPREAASVAWELAKIWQEREPEEEIHLAYGYNMDMFAIPEADTVQEKVELDTWAEAEYNSLPMCAQCGELIENEPLYLESWGEDSQFCSENCAHLCYCDWTEELEEVA